MTIKILFIAPLPPPVTGQSVACQLLYNSLKTKSTVSLVNINKRTFQQGMNSFTRIKEVLSIFITIINTIQHSKLIYFTVSESIAGSLKDIVIYTICWRKLDRVVIHLHGGAGMRVLMSDKHPVLRALNSFFLKRLGGVVVLGDRLKSIYAGLLPPHKLHVVHNFADDELLLTPAAIEAKFAHVKPLRLLFLSNLLPGKGHQELLTALGQLSSDDCAQLHVDFAGGFELPEDEALFRQQVQATKNVQITVHGIVHGELKRDLLRKAHLFCLPTYYPYEGQPISILEAYASGCSVMTTDHSGIFDTFTPGVNGIEVKPRSPESIGQALQHVLTHSQELFEQAKTNHQLALSRYRPAIHIEAMESVLHSILRS